jgi:LPXTG-site transpeptidase (sortase) family protein
MKRYLDTVILGLGIFFFCFGSYLVHERQTTKSFTYTSVIPSSISPNPIKLEIPRIKLSLPVHSAVIENGKWPITTEGVSYLKSTPYPGELGNTLFYGHNWPNLLGNLENTKVGDEIIITNQTGNTFIYTVHFISIVKPTDTHIFQNTSDHRLTLYTCSGLLDSKRLVVTAIQN